MLDWVAALSPIFSAVIGVLSYATLTNYRLDRLDEQVKRIDALEKKINEHETRIKIMEVK